MDEKVSDFFIPDNRITLDEELDYSRVDDFISAADAFSRATYQSVYIIDYYKQKFSYVSPNQILLSDLTPDRMKEIGYKFYLDYVPDDERAMLLEINRAGFSFYGDIPIEERKKWYICYDFHVKNGEKWQLVTHKLAPMALTSDGQVWLALCVVSVSSHSSAGHVEMHRVGSPEYYEYNTDIRRWKKCIMPTLSPAEKDVLTLSMQGYTMAEIADKICLSADSVKKYRQRIFEKLDVKNIAEAIMCASNNKLI
ncbi:MAG: helix-turn-helix transcriptional regulator [Barnesiella sp.]|nr:helix-turn-helix transcriptional regulator [Barnesiella sp.]